MTTHLWAHYQFGGSLTPWTTLVACYLDHLQRPWNFLKNYEIFFLSFYNSHTLLVSISYLNFVYRRFMPKQQITLAPQPFFQKLYLQSLNPWTQQNLLLQPSHTQVCTILLPKVTIITIIFHPITNVKNLTYTLFVHRNLATKKKTKEHPFFGFPIFFQLAWFSFEFTFFLFIQVTLPIRITLPIKCVVRSLKICS